MCPSSSPVCARPSARSCTSSTTAITASPPSRPLGSAENATTVRARDGKPLVTDGPFVGTKEAIGGYFVLEANDLDAAIEIAARIPAARLGGAIEVRPVATYW